MNINAKINIFLYENPILTLLENIMATQEQLITDLTSISTQVAKIAVESKTTLQKVVDLETALAANGSVSPALEQAVAALKAQVQIVDDLVPDTVV